MNCVDCGSEFGELDRFIKVYRPSLQNGQYPEPIGLIHLWHLLNPEPAP